MNSAFDVLKEYEVRFFNVLILLKLLTGTNSQPIHLCPLHSNCDLWRVTEDKVSNLVLKEEISEGLKQQESIFTKVKENILKNKKP